MYRAFNLTGYNLAAISRTTGDAIYKRHSNSVKASLESFLNDKIVDGGKLSAHWFPAIKADVFISHAHQDSEDAIKFAAWLKDTFGLESFIDSCVWGHAADLLAIIDKKYCLNDGGETYNYFKRNDSTSHVHMMLANALSEMLETVECVFFMNTPSSITPNETVSTTLSPWIFYEVGTMRIIRRKEPARRNIINFSKGEIKEAKASLQMEHPVPLSELTPITGAQLNQWANADKSNLKWKHALDFLYDIVPEKQTP